MVDGGATQALQVVGALMILTGYLLTQLRFLGPQSAAFLSLNLCGGVLLTILAVIESQAGFVLMEGAWTIISAVGLTRVAIQRRPES
jgi:hypothetical protein